MRPAGAQTITYGISTDADLRAENIRSGFDGLHFDVVYQGQRQAIESPLVGRINVSNILAAVGVGLSYGMDLAAIAEGIRTCPPVPGRFERVDGGQPFLVVVDYAHTDDALRNVIQVSRELAAQGRVITLFGCGGDRDRTKRPLMGMAAAELSDLVVLTSDNPRSEDPLDIMNDVMVGLRPLRHAARGRAGSRQGHRLRAGASQAGRRGAAGGQRSRDLSDFAGPHHRFRRPRNGAAGAGIFGI